AGDVFRVAVGEARDHHDLLLRLGRQVCVLRKDLQVMQRRFFRGRRWRAGGNPRGQNLVLAGLNVEAPSSSVGNSERRIEQNQAAGGLDPVDETAQRLARLTQVVKVRVVTAQS